MNKIIIHPEQEDFFTQHKNEKRGAKVYGMPISKELASYLEDVAPDSKETRILNMFFAGKFQPVVSEDDFDDYYGD